MNAQVVALVREPRDVLTSLPFATGTQGEVVRLWDVQNSGNWGQDNAVGAAYAEALLDHMQRENNPSLLGQVIAAMAKATGGTFGGIEIGFLHRISLRAIAD